ncbi:MAG TPA: dihydroorotase, partial [Armatimonadetes bacterium]|nr:dihydroorotase [Armatimonadota bacterium]
ARIRRAAVVNVLPQASLTRGHGQEELSDFAELTEAVALTDDAFPLQRADVMRAALREAARRGKLVTVHCEDTTLTAGGVMNEGEVSRALGVKGMPACAEEVMLARNLILAAEAGCRLHVLHLSTAGAVALIRWAKEQGWPVTAEACPHHFCLTEEAVREQGPNAKMNPPLRTAQDVQAIRSALAEGTIDAIATDHAPHTVPEKERGLEAAPFGIVGLETALPLVLTELVEPGLLSLTAALAKLTYLPANILGCDRGTLRPGAVADVTVFDPQAEVVVNPEEFASRGRNTPFAGRRLCGRVRATIVSGKVVYEA